MSNSGDERYQKPKKLVVCCDGTWMDSDNGYVKGSWGHPGHLQTPTNVTRLARAIKPEDSSHHPQIVYYQAGIGTGIGLWNHLIGGGTGQGFSENLREAYAFLANNYWGGDQVASGDSIFLNGFSRGAFTARSLAGLIGQLGLLHKDKMEWFYDICRDWQNAGNPKYEPTFWKNYHDACIVDKPVHPSTPWNDPKRVDEYLDEYRNLLLSHGMTQEVDIKAVGVWDTVGALGIPINPWLQRTFGLPSFIHNYKWIDTSLDKHIKNAFHALALDETRAPYSPALWEKPDNLETNLKQVWFAGAHSNVGGSYRDTSTANITLAWMMDQFTGEEAREKNPDDWDPKDWIEFDEGYLSEQYRRNEMYLKRIGQCRTWGTGTIYNPLTFPQALAGKKIRTPGRNHPRISQNDYIDQSRLLRNTNEFMHASVRARIDLGGRSYEMDPEDSLLNKIKFKIWSWGSKIFHGVLGCRRNDYYVPHKEGPLRDWELQDGHRYHDELEPNGIEIDQEHEGRPPVWTYQGADPLASKIKPLPEDRLGSFEKLLLSKYTDLAIVVETTNLGDKNVDDLKRRRHRERSIGSQARSQTV